MNCEGFGDAKRLANPCDDRIITETTSKTQFDGMNNGSNGKFLLRRPGLILLLSLFLVSCSKDKVPRIKDPEILRKDCAILYQEFAEIIRTNVPAGAPAYIRIVPRPVPREKWTSAILALKPALVIRANFGICILIGGHAYPGYYVFSGGFTEPPVGNQGGESFEDGIDFIKTNMRGIYEIGGMNALL
jgi:hypothetical protein